MRYSSTINEAGYYRVGPHTSLNTLWAKKIDSNIGNDWVFVTNSCLPCHFSASDIFDVSSLRIVSGVSPIQHLSYSSITFLCCGGKSPGAQWDSFGMRWVCKDCGQPQPNGPSREDTRIDLIKLYEPTRQACECGSATLGSDKHSDYCPLYVKP